MEGPHPGQSVSGRFFEFPDVVGMGRPRHADAAKQSQNEVMFIAADVIKKKRCAFAKQIPPQRKDNRPRESTGQIYQKKCTGGKIGYTENDWQNDPESIGKAGNERDKIAVFFNEFKSFSKFFGNGVKAFEQGSSLEVAKVEINLITKKRSCPGGTYNAQNIQIPLKSQKTCQEQNGFTLKKRSDEQHPVSVDLQVLF
jgi:hypothetical protein